MKNRAFFLTAPKTLEMREIAMPVPKAGEVMIKIGAVGVCGSDVHYYSRGRIGDFIVQYPYILGHECAGIVVELGEGVKNLKVGDRVALEPGIPCGKCQMCKTGHYNLCPDVKFFATPPVEGCLMEYVVYPEEYTFKLTDNMTLEQGALVEPMAIGMNAALTAKVKAGDCVLIMGAGCIGLVTMLAAKANGAAKIIVSDVLKLRLDTALRLGATAAINSREDMYKEVMRLTNGEGPDVVIDCAGFSETVKSTKDSLKEHRSAIKDEATIASLSSKKQTKARSEKINKIRKKQDEKMQKVSLGLTDSSIHYAAKLPNMYSDMSAVGNKNVNPLYIHRAITDSDDLNLILDRAHKVLPYADKKVRVCKINIYNTAGELTTTLGGSFDNEIGYKVVKAALLKKVKELKKECSDLDKVDVQESATGGKTEQNNKTYILNVDDAENNIGEFTEELNKADVTLKKFDSLYTKTKLSQDQSL